MKKLLLLLFFGQHVSAQNAYSLFLIGDAGNDILPNKTILTLKKHLENNANSSVVFLGDNIYPKGIDGTNDANQKLLTQLSVLKNYTGEWVFIPGNHDWAKGRWKGYKNIIKQREFLTKFTKDSLGNRHYQFEHFYPKEGFPGPSVLDFGKVMLIITDTDWWLHRQFFHKVGKNNTYKNMENTYLQQLDSAYSLAKKMGKIPLFISHHPLVNYGNQGQPHEPWRFLVNYTPLQFFGLLGINRGFVGENHQPRYKRMSSKMLQILHKYEPFVAISGHEHNLQFIQEGRATYLISGSGSKLIDIPAKSFTKPELKFGKSANGFMELKIEDSGKISLLVWGENGEELFQKREIFKRNF
jgi:hypothetical protein